MMYSVLVQQSFAFPCIRTMVSGMPLIPHGKRVSFFSGVAMANTNDLRRYPRLSSPNGTILAWQTASLRHISHVTNLGLGGLYIQTTDPPPPGTFIQLLFDVPTGEVRARAIVQRSKSKEGMGVKFVAMQQEDRGRFARWLNRLSP